MYNFIMDHLYIVLCAHHPSLISLGYHNFDPIYLFILPLPLFPSGNHSPIACIYEFVFGLFIYCIFHI